MSCFIKKILLTVIFLFLLLFYFVNPSIVKETKGIYFTVRIYLEVISVVLIIIFSLFLISKFYLLNVLWLIIIIFTLLIFLSTVISNLNIDNIKYINTYENMNSVLYTYSQYYLFFTPIFTFLTFFYLFLYMIIPEINILHFTIIYVSNLLLLFLFISYYYFRFYSEFINYDNELYKQYYN